ncbi:hypothetical protein PGT21_019195 [Puccinia graminis f. sp. tritici]|uniref:Uncharacterized protein n=1 Tax=Puccinia graminis f. sp. tritici TaxID=56615 RepID=A0A5B0QN50_PUCGR|nr:hypothetical protein PGT21_019195 [Puccinia graminis f. sp. tritici]
MAGQSGGIGHLLAQLSPNQWIDLDADRHSTLMFPVSFGGSSAVGSDTEFNWHSSRIGCLLAQLGPKQDQFGCGPARLTSALTFGGPVGLDFKSNWLHAAQAWLRPAGQTERPE